MMQFLRKYQRYIFILITVIIVISFSFFGTFNLQWGSFKNKERKITQCLDGSCLTYSAVERMSRFLTSDCHSFPPPNERFFPNLFNDGVLEKDFLESKLAHLLVGYYFEEMKPHLQWVLERAHHYTPYVHPEAKALSAMEVWTRLAPTIIQRLQDMKKEKEVSLNLFSKLSDLYLSEKVFPPEMLRKILIYQLNQHPSLSVDMRLLQEDFSLLGFHSASDWFGPNFIDMLSQFIINMAVVAKEKGYSVSEEEALFFLKENLKKGCEQWKIPPHEGNFQRHLQMLGMQQKELIEIYQNILLFRKYFHEMGGSVFIDTLPYKEVAAFAAETASLEWFELPSYLHLKNFHDLMLLEIYLQSVCPTKANPLDLHRSFDSVEQVEKRAPQLIVKTYQLRIRETDRERVALRVGEKELWEWEVKEEGASLLQGKFFYLASFTSKTPQQRFEILEKLPREKREEVDSYARRKIVEAHSTWISDTLQAASSKEMKIDLRSKMHKSILQGVQNVDRLSSLLEQALSFQNGKNDAEKKAIEELAFFTEDQEHFYSIELLSADKEKRILSFDEAFHDGTLEEMLDQFLEEHWEDARQKRPDLFMKEKSFSQSKDLIGRVLFADLLKAIDEDYRKVHKQLSWEIGQGSLNFYAQHRLYYYMRQLREEVMRQKEWSNKVQKESLFSDQWKLKEKRIDVDRSFDLAWVTQLLFTTPPLEWSSVHIDSSGEMVFFHFIEWKQKEPSFQKELLLQQKKLCFEAQIYLAENLLKKMREKKAIVLPLRKEE